MPVMKKVQELEDALSSSVIVVGWLDDNGALQTARSNLKYRKITGRNTPASAIPASNALIAATMNYGREEGTTAEGRHYPRIPARPFMTFAMEIWQKVFPKLLKEYMPMYMSGMMSIDGLFTVLGEKAKEAVQQAIREGDYAPLSPKTVLAKGSSVPLIDTGTMIESVTFEIRGA